FRRVLFRSCGLGLDSVLKHCSIASAQDRCWRNPYELWSAVVSTTGSSASRYSACWARSFMVGIPSGRIVLPSDFGIRDINTSKRLRLIASTLEFMYGLYLLLWGVPNFSVHTRGFLALVFRHSSNGENFAAVRVGQQALQGSHLAPSAFLHRLHDTHLESANVAVDGLPVNGIPFCRFARDRTNGLRRRHLLCLICRFAEFSRVKHLREVCPLSRPVMWSTQLTQPVSAPLQSSIHFLPDLLSTPPSVHLAMYLPPIKEERYGFTLFRWSDP